MDIEKIQRLFAALLCGIDLQLMLNPSAPEDAKRLETAFLTVRIETIEEQLSSKFFLLGKNYDVADDYLFATLSWGNMSL